MQTCNFYKRSEIQAEKEKKKEDRQEVMATFGITADAGTIKQLIKKFDLTEDWVWDSLI